MAWYYIVLIILGYFLVATVTYWVADRSAPIGKHLDHLFIGILWPFTLPFLLVYVIFMGLFYVMTWIGKKLDKLVDKKPESEE